MAWRKLNERRHSTNTFQEGIRANRYETPIIISCNFTTCCCCCCRLCAACYHRPTTNFAHNSKQLVTTHNNEPLVKTLILHDHRQGLSWSNYGYIHFALPCDRWSLWFYVTQFQWHIGPIHIAINFSLISPLLQVNWRTYFNMKASASTWFGMKHVFLRKYRNKRYRMQILSSLTVVKVFVGNCL